MYSLDNVVDFISCPLSYGFSSKSETLSLDIREVYNILAKEAASLFAQRYFAFDKDFKESKDLKSFEEIWYEYVAKINNLDFSGETPVKPSEHILNSIKIRSFLNYLFPILKNKNYVFIGANVPWKYKEVWSEFDIVMFNNYDSSIKIFQVERSIEPQKTNSFSVCSETSLGIYSLAKSMKILPSKISITYLHPLTKTLKELSYQTELRKFCSSHISSVISCIKSKFYYPNQINCINCIYRDSCDWSLNNSKRGRNFIEVSADLIKEKECPI